MSEAARPARGRPTLRTALVAVLLAALASVLVIVAVTTHLSLRTQLDAQLDAQLDRTVSRGPGPQPGAGPDELAFLDAPGQGEFLLGAVLQDGRAVRGAWRDADGTLRDLGPADLAALERALASAEGGADDRDVDLGIGTYRIRAVQDDTFVTGISTAGADRTIARLDLTLVLVSLGALAGTGLVGSWLVRRSLRPLEGVAQVATRVADMPLDRGEVAVTARVPPEIARGGGEVGEVGRALNALLETVDGALEVRHRSEERMRRFIADASHELRTPLTAIRGYTDLLRLTETLTGGGAEALDRVEAQSARMTSLVEDLLLLARLDDGAPREQERLDMGELLVEAVMDARVTAPAHTWRLDLPDEPVEVLGDPRQLAQVLANLLSNARKHTPPGTIVQARLRSEEGRAVLELADDGPGISSSVQGDVFGRFTRADRARSGGEGTAGLGLPIVQAILTAHGGDIAVASRPGRTVFTARIPRADADGT
ncbi:sensor histidine kinase [Brachybacterium hainanense]|uniref:histidine kinase n=1 Tax=Brachybacterium hainanense TaxID=1541174 RepID=A0ABV6RG75_9MICO